MTRGGPFCWVRASWTELGKLTMRRPRATALCTCIKEPLSSSNTSADHMEQLTWAHSFWPRYSSLPASCTVGRLLNKLRPMNVPFPPFSSQWTYTVHSSAASEHTLSILQQLKSSGAFRQLETQLHNYYIVETDFYFNSTFFLTPPVKVPLVNCLFSINYFIMKA